MKLTVTQRIMLGICISCWILIPIWLYAIIPELQKMPIDYHKEVKYLGEVQWRDPGENLSSPFIQDETHTESVVNVEGDILTIKLESVVVNPTTGELFWHVVEEVKVSRATKAYAAENETSFYSFPYHTEKRDYNHMQVYSYLPPTKFTFEREEEVMGLNTYVFSYDVTAINNSAFFPLWVAEGEHPVMDDWGLFWVEPTSGYIVNAKDYWDAYLIDPVTGEKGIHIDIGRIWYTEDTIAKEVRTAQNLKQTIFLQEILVPILFAAVAGATSVAIALGSRIRKE